VTVAEVFPPHPTNRLLNQFRFISAKFPFTLRSRPNERLPQATDELRTSINPVVKQEYTIYMQIKISVKREFPDYDIFSDNFIWVCRADKNNQLINST
jgi:hypothetical protein